MKTRIVYIGFQPGANLKDVHVYMHIQDEATGIDPNGFKTYRGTLRDTMTFGKRLVNCEPGTVLEVEINDEPDGGRSVAGAGRTIAGLWHSKDERQEWIMASRVARTSRDAQRKIKRQSHQDLKDLIEPLRQAYKRVGHAHRAAWIVTLYKLITRP